jgi:proline iminopeptidase
MPVTRRGRPITAAVAAAGYSLWVRPRLRTWDPTTEEVARNYPGDELIADPDDWATMAATLPVPTESVWPWLAQMGGDRGGRYSRDWLDNNGRPSANRVMPQWQHLKVGQQLSRVGAPGQEPGSFTVVALEPNRTLVLRSSYGLFTGRDVPFGSAVPSGTWVDGIWGFHLRPAPGGGTRLVARSRNRGAPHVVTRPFAILLGEPMHFAMQTRQFRNLSRRVAAPFAP